MTKPTIRPFVFALLVSIPLFAASAQENPISLVADLADTADPTAGLDPGWITTLGDQLFFSGWSHLTGRELWTSDGTAEGTRMVFDACPGTCPGFWGPIVPLAGALYFPICDGSSTCTYGAAITDGTAAGTSRLLEFEAIGRRAPRMGNFLSLGETLFFTLEDPALGEELWRSDGTSAEPGW